MAEIVLKRGNEAAMPLLAAGELAFAMDTKRVFIGTGTENIPVSGSFVEKDTGGNVKLTGNITLKGSGNFGNKINFGDGDYVHISEPTDNTLELKGARIKLFSSSTEVLKIEGGKAYVNGVEFGGGSGVLDFDIMADSKGYKCVTAASGSTITETLTKTSTAKRTAVRTTTRLSNGYQEVTTFYGEDGVAVKETRTKTTTKTAGGYSEVIV